MFCDCFLVCLTERKIITLCRPMNIQIAGCRQIRISVYRPTIQKNSWVNLITTQNRVFIIKNLTRSANGCLVVDASLIWHSSLRIFRGCRYSSDTRLVLSDRSLSPIITGVNTCVLHHYITTNVIRNRITQLITAVHISQRSKFVKWRRGLHPRKKHV